MQRFWFSVWSNSQKRGKSGTGRPRSMQIFLPKSPCGSGLGGAHLPEAMASSLHLLMACNMLRQMVERKRMRKNESSVNWSMSRSSRLTGSCVCWHNPWWCSPRHPFQKPPFYHLLGATSHRRLGRAWRPTWLEFYNATDQRVGPLLEKNHRGARRWNDAYCCW